jgi:3-oxoacyl-[acyl-carrier-protein] synthase-3
MKGSHLEVAGTGSYLPEERITNDNFTGRLLNFYDVKGNVIDRKEFTAEGIVRVTGIEERRKSAPDEFPSDMGYRAAVKAIEKSGISADSLVGIIFATVTEDVNFPSAACKVQKKLGVRGCFAYDVADACAGFPEILAQANTRVLRCPGNYLCIAADCLTKMVDDTDANSTLFGDGAGAVVLTPTEERTGILGEYSISDPFDGQDKMIFRDANRFLRMPEGQAVMKRAIYSMVESARVLKEEIGWEKADVYIPHQANIRIIQGVERKVAREGAEVFTNIDKYGNMSAATCAIALDEALEQGVIKPRSRVIVTSFGGGLVTSAVGIQF